MATSTTQISETLDQLTRRLAEITETVNAAPVPEQAPAPVKPLHEMTAQEFRAATARMCDRRAEHLGSPSWRRSTDDAA